MPDASGTAMPPLRVPRGLLAFLLVVAAAGLSSPQSGPSAGRLVVSVIPNPAPCRNSDEPLYAYVQAVDPQGVPLASTTAGQPPLVVTLHSSDPKIAEVYGSDGNLARIDRGSSYGRGVFVSRATSTCGSTTITASAPGYAPVTAGVTTMPRGGKPAALKLYAFPERMPVKGREVQVVAQLLDAAGTPTYAESRPTLRLEASPASALLIPIREQLFSEMTTTTHFAATINETPGQLTLTASLGAIKSAPLRLAIDPPPAALRQTDTPPVAQIPAAPPTPKVPPAPTAIPTAPPTPGGVPTAKFTDDSVCDQSRWPVTDVPWQPPSGSPKTTGPGEVPAASVASPLDFATLTTVQYGGAVSAAMESMRLVYGPLSPDETARFEAKWAPLLDFPTIEIVTYLNKLNPLLGQFLVARSGYAAAANGLFVGLHDGGIAMASGSEEGAKDGWFQARAYRTLMATYEAKLREIVAAIETLGNPPNPYDLKCRARKQAKEALSVFEATGGATFHLTMEEEKLRRVLEPQICGFRGTLPLVGATVVLEGPTSARGVADDTGTVNFSALTPGSYRVRILDASGRDLDTVAREYRQNYRWPGNPGGPPLTLGALSADELHQRKGWVREDTKDWCQDSLSFTTTRAGQLDAFTLDAKTSKVEREISFGSNLFGIVNGTWRAHYVELLAKSDSYSEERLRRGSEWDGRKFTPAEIAAMELSQERNALEMHFEVSFLSHGLSPSAAATLRPTPSGAKPKEPAAAPIVNEDAARQQYIQTIARRVSEYDKQLATETDPRRRSDLEFLKLIAVSEIQLEQAHQRTSSEGQPAFIRTALGDYVRLAEYQKSVEEAQRSQVAGRIWTAIDKQIAVLPEDVGENWRMAVGERARRRGITFEDIEKAEQELTAVSGAVQSYWSREAGRNLEKAAYYEWVENTPKTISKVAIGVALIGLSAPAATVMFGESALVMTWAPKAAGFVYGGVTGYREGGPVEGVKGALTWASGVTFAGVEAYNGYEAEMAQSGDWKAAATAGATRGVEAYAAGKLIEKTFAFGASLFGPAAPASAPRLDVARYQQELRMAEEKIAAFKRASDRLSGARAVGAPAERLAALKQLEQEAAADINASYQAKLRLKYADPTTGRAYTQVMKGVYNDVSDPFFEALTKKGYDISNLRFKTIRNASSEATVGMDFDLMLEQDAGLIIRKNGAQVSALTLEKDAQEILNDVYFKRLGRSPEKSFLNVTTSSHPEAYAELAWLGDKTTKKINFEGIDPSAAQAGEVSAFKARHAEKTIGLSEISKVQEATRGLAKDVNTKVVPYIDFKLAAASAAGDAAGVARLRALKAQWTSIGSEYNAIGTTVGDAGSILTRLRDLEARGLGVNTVTNAISSHMETLGKFYKP